jgi:ribonuclease HII
VAERPRGPAGCEHEAELLAAGFRRVAGIDEAGRGAWAGPLVAAAVVLREPLEQAAHELRGVRDSKQLSPQQRAGYYERIRATARAIGVGVVPPAVVDELGLSAAGRLAMADAVRSLWLEPDFLLIDAYRVPELTLPQRPLVFGDCLSASIASASVVAKVVRDHLMAELDVWFPGYGFARHKGYGTAEHRAALQRHGACTLHRTSYAPLRLLAAADG